MEKISCVICLKDVRCPVHMLPFPCKTHNNIQQGIPSCNDTVIVCMPCAQQYLHMNQFPVHSRPDRVKCLICESTCNPRTLFRSADAFQKDFTYMRLDNTNNYPCFHEELGCKFTGTQSSLDRHLRHQCLYRTVKCICGFYCKAVEMDHHILVCSHHKSCTFCLPLQKRFSIDEISQHIIQEHGKVACTSCSEWIDCDKRNIHEDQCPQKIIACEICNQFCYQGYFEEHVLFHIRQGSDVLIRLKQRERLFQENDPLTQQEHLVEYNEDEYIDGGMDEDG